MGETTPATGGNAVSFPYQGTGNEDDWSNPTNVLADDATYSNLVLNGTTVTQSEWLYVYNFGEVIPSGEEITGIQITIDGKQTLTEGQANVCTIIAGIARGGVSADNDDVELIVGGEVVMDRDNTFKIYTIGGDGILPVAGISNADALSANWGIVLRLQYVGTNEPGGNDVIRFDYVDMKLYSAVPPAAGGSLVAGKTGEQSGLQEPREIP